MAEKKTEEVKEVKDTRAYKLVEVATQTGMVIQNKDGVNLEQVDVLVEILNKLDKIERSIA